jgi:DNA-binding transcriptional ArsR family regulator
MARTARPKIDPQRMRERAAAATSLLRTIANEDRLILLCQLAQGERSVGELEALLDIHQPTLSQQLAVLRQDRLVVTRRDGKHVFYRIGDERVLALLDSLYDHFCKTKGALA